MDEVISILKLDGEIRDGFYVSSLMKRAWYAQIEILKKIDVLCKKHHIEYFATYGTLLGAIRHQGFIPWDDDTDIGMLRKDYEKFRKVAATDLPQGYVMLDGGKGNYEASIARVLNHDEITLQQDFLDEYWGCPYIMGVDIFCFDQLPKEKKEEEQFLELFQCIDSFAIKWDSGKIREEEKADYIKLIEQVTRYHFKEDAPIKQQLLCLSDRIAAMYYDEGANEVADIRELANNLECRIPVCYLEHTEEVPFENIMIPVPIESKKVLEILYGEDYMTFQKNSAGHPYPFFRDQIEKFRLKFQEAGKEFPREFDLE